MTKREFLNRLKEALENGLDSRAVQENMDYYRSYIEEEEGWGQSEEEVIEELGDPWVIAQSVINMAENRSAAEGGYGTEGVYHDGRAGSTGGQRYSNTQIHTYMTGGWWKGILLLLGMIGIVLIIFAVIGGLLSLVLPVLLPVLVVIMVLRLIGRMR
ncbi:MAG: DUF1700 domain-containing protein [Dorea sp.]|nr:DUF1700 domain-containing protein [Dorea sp.]